MVLSNIFYTSHLVPQPHYCILEHRLRDILFVVIPSDIIVSLSFSSSMFHILQAKDSVVNDFFCELYPANAAYVSFVVGSVSAMLNVSLSGVYFT